jgi:hypothetical protein
MIGSPLDQVHRIISVAPRRPSPSRLEETLRIARLELQARSSL